LTANSSWKYADGTYVFTDLASSTLSATEIDSKTWLVSLSAVSATFSKITVAANTAIYLVGANIKDLSGNAMSSDAGTSAATDATPPAMTVGDISCVKDAKTKIVRNGLTIEAAAKGVATNAWTLSVVNQRGILTPTIVEDAAAKTITITADTGYHTADDLVKIAKNTGINATTWVYSGTGAVPAATLLGPVTYLTAGAGGNAGDQDCSATVTFTEPVLVSGTPTVTVANVAATAVSIKETDYSTSIGATTYYTEAQLFFTTTGSGAVNVTGVALVDRDGANSMASNTNTGATLG